jgi:hypothetical protein
MASALVPLGKIVYVCDDVVQDALSGKLTVIGAFNALRPLLDCPFPAPGTYLVQLFCDRSFIDDRRLTAH